MIAVVVLMLRHRWRRALVIAILASFTYGIAVAVPAYLAAADRAMIANEVAHATTPELTISAEQPLDLAHGRDRSFETGAPARFSAPWLNTTFGVDINVDTAPSAPGTVPTAAVPKLVYRQGYCAHVTLSSGRCPLTAREVMLDDGLARLLHVTAGGQIPLWWAYLGTFGWIASPEHITVSVVGIYHISDPGDPYWGNENYFGTPGPINGRVAPILTERGTIDALSHLSEDQHVDASLRPDAITDATIGSIGGWIASRTKPVGNGVVTSSTPALLTRIEADRRTVREVLPDIAVAVIVIGCFVLFLTVSHAVGDRGGEVGVVRLRGVSAPARWWLGGGESLVPVALGIGLGFLIGRLLAGGAVALTLPGRADLVSATGGRLGAATIAAMLVALVAAHLRTLSAPVTDALRRIPPRVGGWRSATAQVIVGILAAIAVVQLYAQPGPLTGITLIAPASVIIALGLFAGPVVLPLAGWVGRRALAGVRGRVRLGVGLGALASARRPGAHLLLTVQVIALGLAGFAAANVVSDSNARSESVALTLGAPRVVDVGPAVPSRLLRAVRDADPTGRYAMAVVSLPRKEADDPPVLAVDGPRLAAVTTWPRQDHISPATVAAELHPPIAEPPVFTARAVTLDVTTYGYQTYFGDAHTNPLGGRIGLRATFALEDGSTQTTLDLGNLRLGAHGYAADIPACLAGCRLISVSVKQRSGSGEQFHIRISDLTAAGSLPWSDASRWQVTGSKPTLSANTAGLSVELPQLVDAPNGISISLIDAPKRLPTVVAGANITSVPGVAGIQKTGAPLPLLPGLGAHGVLVDLEYLTRLSPGTTPVSGAVWLAANAPARIVAALADAGYPAISDQTSATARTYLDQQGPAVGVRFGLIAAAAGVVLAMACVALMAGVDRDGRAHELSALRVQGLSQNTARRAAIVSHLGLVGLACIGGAVAAAAAWRLTGSRLPVFTDGHQGALPASAAPWSALIAAVVIGTALLAITAFSAGMDLSRRIATRV